MAKLVFSFGAGMSKESRDNLHMQEEELLTTEEELN